MEVTLLEQARLTFAATAMYHFLFVPLTIGLAGVVAILQAIAVFRRDVPAQRLLDVFAPIFLINFVCGMITGYPLRSLIQHDWSVYLASSRPVFETVFAFENALLPVNLALVAAYAFGRRWIPPVWQIAVLGALCVCLMAQGSAILAINCYMQSPYGVDWAREGVVFHGGLPALFANPMWFQKFMHQMAAAMTLGATCCMSLSALFLLRRRQIEASRFVLRASAGIGLASLLVTAYFGHESAHTLIRLQPMKFAAAEAIWDAPRGSDRSHPLILFGLPDPAGMRNTHVVQIPGLLTRSPARTAVRSSASRSSSRRTNAGSDAASTTAKRSATPACSARGRTRPRRTSPVLRARPCPTSRSCSGRSGS
jgi:cytochrome d ubiquinol oxidase subunit I